MAPKIKIGFICGKDTDYVEDPGKAAPGPIYKGDKSFLSTFPAEYRVDIKSREYLRDAPKGARGFAHCDCALAHYISVKYPDVQCDIITPEEISIPRLHQNDVVFTLGYNAVNISVENNESGPAKMDTFRRARNIYPIWEVEDHILTKSKYMKKCLSAGVSMAPTIFAPKATRSPEKLLKQIKQRGWKDFVMKQSESGFCLGFMKLSTEKAEENNGKLLREYFAEYDHCPEFIVQEFIPGFTRNWETRCFWFNGKFLYAIANKAAVSTADGKECIVTGDDIPPEFLKEAKRIGKEAIKCVPHMKTCRGQSVQNVLLRTDIGCSDSPLCDKDNNWDGSKRTFFLNEIEPSSTTYFVRWLKFDCIPLYAKLYVQKAREIYKQMHSTAGKKTGAAQKAVKNGVAKKTQKKAMVMKKAMKTKSR